MTFINTQLKRGDIVESWKAQSSLMTLNKATLSAELT